jgi:uncharacterized repeat protein (TIGR01451 family)
VSGGCGACVGGPTPGNACTANANCGTGGTCNAGLCDRRTNEGDVDFWSLGDVPAGNKIWVGVEAVQANDFDFRMRITSTTETLGFDDDDATALQGGLSAVYSGAKSTGGPAYARVSRTTGFESGPYRLYANVTPPLAQAQPEANGIDSPGNDFNWPGDGYFATYLNNTAFPAANGFVSGQFAIATDTDCWQLLANEGDDIAWWADGNPNQVDTASPAVPQFIMYDAQPAAISNFVFGTGAKRQLGPYPGAGLDALTPQNTSFFMHWRARYTGAFELCAYSFVGVFPEPPPYPKFYAGSITVNCQPPRPAGPGTSTGEVSITKSGPAGPVPSSSLIDYTITVTHSGNDIAQGVQMVDTLPPELVFIGLSIEDGLGGNNTACISLPSPGTADAPIDCMTMSMAPGATTVYTVTVKVVDCLEGGTDILNTATIASTVSIDPDDSNNSASWTFTSSANSLCSDLFCDTVLCIENLCTLNDHCEGNVCVTTLNTCNDNSVCTNDSCAIATGVCTNDGTPGAECSDGNPCTADLCDPVDFCVFPPAAQGIVCDDFFGCTNDDVCDGQGNCAGLSVCSDGNACTDDFADENDNCACSHEPTFAGAPCSDGDACTTDDTCDGANTCVAGTGTPDCNDNNPCTDDSCDPNVGCVNTNNSNPCDDGNACTTGDACGGGSCQSGGPLVCNDGNDCTDDSCNPASGCVYTDNSNACDDGNACTVGDSCGGGTCNGGAPVVCTASDQCHDAGVCNPGSGTCSNPAKADGTTCDDGNPNTSGDNCQAGVCTGGSTCPASPNPKSKGYYKKLCNNNHSGDSLTDADAQCVASLTVTFSSFSTVNDICSELSNAGTGGDTCAKERDQLLVVALNICKERLCQAGEIDSRCNSGSKTVGQSLSEMDVIFSNPNSSANTCSHGGCLGEEINTGRALKLNSLSVSIQAGHAHLSWDAPVFDDGTNAASSYTIWRRPQGSEAPFQQIGATTDLLFVDTATGSLNWQYEVLTIEPQP